MKQVIGAVATALCAAALSSAPAALAGPAPTGVENDYISALAFHGQKGPRSDELKLGYLLCALSQVGGKTPAGGQLFLNTAQATGLCDSVSTEGRPTKEQLQNDLKYALQQSWMR
jgi:hypothetical protein